MTAPPMVRFLQCAADSQLLTFFQGLIMLEKELAYLGSVCAAALMKKDLALPIGTQITDNKLRCCKQMILRHIMRLAGDFNPFLSFKMPGNELEEDLEILEEASLQVSYLLRDNTHISFL